MSNLNKETTDRIEKEAEAYAETHGDHLSNIKEYSTHNDISGAYNSGATEWAGRAEEHLIPALEWIKTYGPCDALAVKFIDNALAKYKEVSNA